MGNARLTAVIEHAPTQTAEAGRWGFDLRSIWYVLLFLVVFYVCFFSHLGALGVVGPDEPRYASVAREMAESGDWVTPRLYGKPWFEKPVLFYWAAALAYRKFGVNEFAARLPSALAAALAALALAWAAWKAWRFEGLAAARYALLIFPTCVATFGFARAAGPDTLFAAALTAAMVAGFTLVWRLRAQARSEARAWTAGRVALVSFGVFLGLATLAKGPAAIVLAGGSVGLWAILTRCWRAALRLAHPLAIIGFAVTALPWYVLCAARNPEFLRTFLFTHNLERYLTPIFQHRQPFWFYAPVLLLGLLPWTVLLIGVARDAIQLWQEKRWADSPGLFFGCWALFPVVFFSFSQSKLPGYVLPAVPPLALLLARSVAHLIENKGRFASNLFVGIGLTLVALGAAASFWLGRLPLRFILAKPHQVVAWVVPLFLGGLAIAVLGLRRRPAAALLAAAALMTGLVEAANQRALPRLDKYVSPRVAARAVQIPPGTAENISVYRLRRAWRYGLNFYLHQELPDWTPRSARPGWVYTNEEGFAELQRQGVKCFVAARDSPQALLVRVES